MSIPFWNRRFHPEVRGSLQMQSFAKRLVPRAGLDALVLAPELKQSHGACEPREAVEDQNTQGIWDHIKHY